MNLWNALLRKYGNREEAQEALDNMIESLVDGNEDPETLLHDEGLEPDYVIDLCFAAEKWIKHQYAKK